MTVTPGALAQDQGERAKLLAESGGASPAAASPPSNNAVMAYKDVETYDKHRKWLGTGSFVISVGLVGGVFCFAWHSVETLAALSQPGTVYLAKAIIVASLVGFSLALLRVADRMTLPFAVVIRVEEARSKRAPPDEQAKSLIDLLREAADLAKLMKGQP